MVWFTALGGQRPFPVRDQGIYLRAAESISSGQGLSFSTRIAWLKHTQGGNSVVAQVWNEDPWYVFGLAPVEEQTAVIEPGYPVLLGLLFAVTGPVMGSVFLLNCAFALIGVWAVRRMVSDGWGRRAGMTAALIWALYPYYIYYSAYAMSDSIHISLLPLVAWLTIRAGDSGRGGAATGISTGILFLIRSTALFLLPVQAGYLLLKRKWRAALWMTGAFVLCCIPWVVRNQITLGSPLLMPTKGSLNLWMRYNPEALAVEGIELPGWVEESIEARDLLEYPSMEGLDEVSRSRLIGGRAIDFILANPLLVAYLAGLRFLLFMSPFGGTVGGILPAAVGLLIYVPMLIMSLLELIHRRRDGRVLFLAAVLVLYTAFHTMAHGGVRYRLPVDMVLIVLSTLFIVRRFGLKGQRR